MTRECVRGRERKSGVGGEKEKDEVCAWANEHACGREKEGRACGCVYLKNI